MSVLSFRVFQVCVNYILAVRVLDECTGQCLFSSSFFLFRSGHQVSLQLFSKSIVLQRRELFAQMNQA